MQINDYDEIRNLLGRYAHLADDWKFDEQAKLFTPNGVLVEGGKEIPMHTTNITMAKQYVAALLSLSQPRGFKHLTCNSVITVEGDTARATSDLLAMTLSPDKGWILGSGRYDDEIVKYLGRWHFQRREVTFYRGLGLNPLGGENNELLAHVIDSALLSSNA